MEFPNFTEQVRSHLFAGERILWSGRPKQGLAFSGRDIFLVPFSLMWGGFAIFWNFSVWYLPKGGSGPDWFFKLWGLPFLIVGIYLIVGRFWHDAALHRRLVYAVTDQRVIVSRSSRFAKFQSLDIKRLPRLDLSEHGDGSGTIEFEANPMFGSSGRNGFGLWIPALSSVVLFFRIADSRHVYEIVRKQAYSV